MLRVPAVVVRDEGDGAVADLGLARQLGFLKVCHTDERHAQAPVDLGFRLRRELRSFHADVGSAAFDRNVHAPSALLYDIAKPRADRVGEADVHDDSVTKERGDAGFRPIIELFRQNDVERAQFLFQGADSARREDPLDSQFF